MDLSRSLGFASVLTALSVSAAPADAALAPNADLTAEAPGLSIAVRGTGLSNATRTGAIAINIGGSVQKAFLYWAGEGQPVGEQTLRLNEVPFVGSQIGIETTGDISTIGYRADVTAFVQNLVNGGGPGAYNIAVDDPSPIDNLVRMHGASLFVLYTDPADPVVYRVMTYEGMDYAYLGYFPGPNAVTEPVTFAYSAAAFNRSADLVAIVAEAQNGRPDRINVSGNASINDSLDASDGPEWDTDVHSISVPSGVASTTVEVVSPLELANSDSLAWLLSAMRLPLTPPTEPSSCCESGVKVHTLVMRYTGDDCSASHHMQAAGKVTCSGDPADAPLVRIKAYAGSKSKAKGKGKKGQTQGGSVWFDGMVALNDSFVISAANAGATKLNADTMVDIYSVTGLLLQSIKFHTSCSQPLFTGDQFGSLLLLECNPTPPGGSNFCTGGVKPGALVMTYTGSDCSATSHSQAAGKVACTGDPGGAVLVRIRASDSATADAGSANVYFDGVVALDTQFTIDAANAGLSRLKTDTYLHVFDMQGSLLQTVKFHTSCSQPLIPGDQYGSARLDDFVAAN